MKRKVYIIACMMLALLLIACSKNSDTMEDYIATEIINPTPVGDGTVPDATPSEEQPSEEQPSTDEPIVEGETTPKYVKLSEFDAFLNVRSTPSADGEKKGILVHTELINVIDIKDGWASFLMNDEICYVKAEFLVDERPEFIDPPTATPTPIATPTPVATPPPVATPTPTMKPQPTAKPTPKPTPTTKPTPTEKPAPTPIPSPVPTEALNQGA